MFMRASFRLRVALLSMALSGFVLTGFGAWAWFMVYRSNLHRIDSSLRDIAQQHLMFPRGPGHWATVDESLQFVFGEDSAGVLLAVVSSSGTVLHRSTHWPEGMDRLPALPEVLLTGPVQRPAPVPPPPPHFDGPHPDTPPPLQSTPIPMGPTGSGGQRRGQGPGPGGPPPHRPGPGPPREPLPLRRPEFVTREAGGQTWRMAVFGNPDVTVVMGVSLAGFRQQMAGVRTAFLVAIPLALLGIAAGSWLIASRALRPVRRLSETLARVSAQGLDQRAPETGELAEFQQLVRQFNGMMERLERSFAQAARFSADAAHELKTPLTVLQGEIEQALQKAPVQQQQTYARLLDEVQRLKIITEKLLLLARADAGQLRIQAGPFDLSAAVSELAEDAAALAPKLTVAADISPGVWIHADRDLLQRALHNVIDNAIKYNRDGGLIRIELQQVEGTATCRISNTGDIPPDRRDKVFDRFVRVDAARSRRVDGSGLGLSLAREIVRAHGGELALAAVENGVVTFEIRIRAIAPRSLPPLPHNRFPIGSHQEARQD